MSFNSFAFQVTGPKAGTAGNAGTVGVTQDAPPAGAPQGAAPSPPGGGLIMMLPLLVLGLLLFTSMRRQKKESDARAKLKKGDKVVTNAGLVGELMELDDRFAKVKIAPGVVVQIVAATVSSLEASASAKDGTKDGGKAGSPDKAIADAKVALEKK